MSEDGLDTLVLRGSLERKLFGARPAELSIGRFYVLERLGEGGMGVVYTVYDDQLDRRVALKLLKGDATVELRLRLRREARAMAQLSHPNVVPVFEVGEHDGRLFIVLEYVRGQTLRQWASEEQRSVAGILDRYVQAGRGLAAAHAAGIVHRDFKPDNAIVGASGRVRVLDFGLARTDTEVREAPARPASAGGRPEPDLDTPLTETGSVVGTPAYMAPEQFIGSAVDHRTDQFAFCVALWEAVCQARPFAGTTRGELSINVTDGALVGPPRESPMPTWLRQVLERGLQPRPDARWASMDALLDRIEGQGRTPRRWLRGGLVAIPVLAAAGGLAWAQSDEDADPCVDGPALIGETWGPERRSEVRRALEAVEVGYAAQTAERVDGVLAAYALDWVAGHRDACEATLLRRAQSSTVMDQRMRCLDDRKRRFGALLSVLVAADEAALETAPRSAAGLPRIDSCADLGYVASDVPPPDDPNDAARARRMADELADAAALDAAGKPGKALVLAQRSREAARSLGYEPMRLHASNEVAKALFGLGKYDGAVAAALEGFEVSDLGARQAAANNLVILGRARHARGEYDAALAYRKKALVILGRLHGEDHPEVAHVHGRISETLMAQGKLDEAVAEATTMLDMLARTVEEDHLTVGLAHGHLGRVLEAKGEYDAALEHGEIALAIKTQRLGPDHPDVAASQVSIGLGLRAQGKHTEALEWYDKGLATQLRSWGPDHPQVGATYNNIAVSHEHLGRLHEALAGYEKARDIWTRALGEDHVNVSVSLANMAEVYLRLGKLDDALANHRAALAIRERVLGEEHPRVASSHVSIGHVFSGMGRVQEALAHYEIALSIEVPALGADHPDVASTHEALGSALVAVDRIEEGIAHLDKSLSIYAKVGSDHPAAGWTHLAMGRAVTTHQGCAAASVHFRDAASIWQRAFDDVHPHLARPLAAIATCSARPDEAKAAREHLQRVAAAASDSPVVDAHLALVEARDARSKRAAGERLVELGEWVP